MNEEVGEVAVEGQEYEIKGGTIFREADYDRQVNGKGKSIYIYQAKDKSKVWENGSDPEKEETTDVPKYCRVRVIGATVTFTRQ